MKVLHRFSVRVRLCFGNQAEATASPAKKKAKNLFGDSESASDENSAAAPKGKAKGRAKAKGKAEGDKKEKGKSAAEKKASRIMFRP